MAERKAPFPNPPMCSTPHSDRAHTRASFQPRGCDVEPKQRDLGAPPRFPLHTPSSSAADEPRQTDPQQRDTVALNAHCPIVPPGGCRFPAPKIPLHCPEFLAAPNRRHRPNGHVTARTLPLAFCLLERGRLGLLYSRMGRKFWLFQATFAQVCSAQFLHLVHIPHLLCIE